MKRLIQWLMNASSWLAGERIHPDDDKVTKADTRPMAVNISFRSPTINPKKLARRKKRIDKVA